MCLLPQFGGPSAAIHAVDFNIIFGYVKVRVRRAPRNVRIACSHSGLTHYGGIFFFNEFTRVLQLRRFLTRHLQYPRRNQRYTLSQMIMALVYPVILGLDRLETASLLRSNGTFQYLTHLLHRQTASYCGVGS